MESSSDENAMQLRVNLSGRHKVPISDPEHRLVEVELTEVGYIRVDDNAPAPMGSRSLATLSLLIPHPDFLHPRRFRDALSGLLSVFEELGGDDDLLETLVPGAVSFAYDTGFREMKIGIEILVVKTTLCDGDACAICLDPISVSESMLEVMPCGHVFHQQCSEQWLERSNKCPLCRETCFTDIIKEL